MGRRGREDSPIATSSYRARLRWSPCLVNFVPAVAYHICLAMPAAFTQPKNHLLAEPCAISLRRKLPGKKEGNVLESRRRNGFFVSFVIAIKNEMWSAERRYPHL